MFFEFPFEIRKIIYTINLIENLNGKMRTEKHITNTKDRDKRMSKIHEKQNLFPTDDAFKNLFAFL